jgi:hypothetical protein
MANQVVDAGGELLLRTFRDMGDGTYAEVMATVEFGSNALVTLSAGTAAWANNAAAGTAVDIDVTPPENRQREALYEIIVTDPSSESDLTVVVKNKETFGGTARYPELTRFGVVKSNADGIGRVVQGWLLGEGARITITNDTLIGAGGAFTAYVRVRRL